MTSVTSAAPAWGAVFSMSLAIFGLVGAEFLPVSLLTPIADDLQVTEGMAGQAVTATAAVALVTSLLVTVVSGRFDRRNVLIFFSAMLIVSNLLVAAAPNLTSLLIARVLLGIGLGGSWALSAATIMRLVPDHSVPKALAILFGGVSAATVFAAPFGSYFGELMGWRAVFVAAAGIGVAALVMQLPTLPAMPRLGTPRLGTLLALYARPGFGPAMLSVLFVFTGIFGVLTYLRPYLEQVTQVDTNGVTTILLVYGIGTFVGNSLSGQLIGKSLRGTLSVMPVILAMAALFLSLLGGNVIGDTAAAAVVGVAVGIVPVSWSTWITRNVPEEAESAGGMFIATINLAIAAGAAGGGAIFDLSGPQTVFLVSAIVLALALIPASLTKTQD